MVSNPILIMHNLKTNFDKFFSIAKSIFEEEVSDEGNFKHYPKKPKMSDLQIIALSSMAEALSIDSENWLFSKLKSDYATDFPNLIHRSNFNRRRKVLADKAAELARKACLKFRENDSEFIIDSMPVPICPNVRAGRIKVCKDDPDLMPTKAYHASHRIYYYGFKLHLVISKEGFPFATGLTTASMHDSQYIPFLKEDNLPECQLLGDRGYISSTHQLSLFEQAKVRLITPMKSNMKAISVWGPKQGRIRKIIETLFSQLCDQLMIKRNYAKTLEGLFARIIAKIASVSILKIINKMKGKPINKIKHALLI